MEIKFLKLNNKQIDAPYDLIITQNKTEEIIMINFYHSKAINFNLGACVIIEYSQKDTTETNKIIATISDWEYTKNCDETETNTIWAVIPHAQIKAPMAV